MNSQFLKGGLKMSKTKKIISIIVCLLVLTVMVPIMIEYHNVSGLDPQFFRFTII